MTVFQPRCLEEEVPLKITQRHHPFLAWTDTQGSPAFFQASLDAPPLQPLLWPASRFLFLFVPPLLLLSLVNFFQPLGPPTF